MTATLSEKEGSPAYSVRSVKQCTHYTHMQFSAHPGIPFIDYVLFDLKTIEKSSSTGWRVRQAAWYPWRKACRIRELYSSQTSWVADPVARVLFVFFFPSIVIAKVCSYKADRSSMPAKNSHVACLLASWIMQYLIHQCLFICLNMIRAAQVHWPITATTILLLQTGLKKI